ncbi:RNA polymerase sigma factor SigA [compost metagenome]
MREKSYEKVVEDSLKLYMDHIGAVPLLSFEEEERLAWEIKQGDKAAKLIFIMSYLRLVVSVANKYNSNAYS